jgi:hypothetical protein
MEIVVIVVFVQCLVFAPLLVFAPQLAATRWRGRMEYGIFASRYKSAQRDVWQQRIEPAEKGRSNSNDGDPLVDPEVSYEAVRSMNVVPVTWQASFSLAAATLIPIAPLLLTMMPMEELLKKLFGILFR